MDRQIGLKDRPDTRVELRVSGLMREHIDALIMDEYAKFGYHPTLSEVAESLLWKGIRA